jgi:hypothetical protein
MEITVEGLDSFLKAKNDQFTARIAALEERAKDLGLKLKLITDRNISPEDKIQISVLENDGDLHFWNFDTSYDVDHFLDGWAACRKAHNLDQNSA